MRRSQASLIGTLVGAGLWGLSGTAAQALFQVYQFPVVALVAVRTLSSALILLIIVRPARPERNPARPQTRRHTVNGGTCTRSWPRCRDLAGYDNAFQQVLRRQLSLESRHGTNGERGRV